jgi:hypothetical protein
MKTLKRLLGIFMFLLSSQALAYDFPLCTNNQVDELIIGNPAVLWRVYMCYTTPSSFKVKINKISLIKSDNSVVDFYSPSTPDYVDLTQGLSDLARNVTPQSGTYQALRVSVDATWKITASANYTPSSWTPAAGPVEYCRTKSNANTFANTSLTGNGHGSSLNGTDVSAVETLFKSNAFNFEIPGATGSDNQQDTYGTIYPYFSKMTYPINSAEVSRIEHYFVNSSGALETNSSNITGAYIDVYFTNPVTINADTDLSYTLNFDLTKGIGFGFDMSTNGGVSIQDDNTCNFMTIGPMAVTLSVEQ